MQRFIVLPFSASPAENKKPELTPAAMTLQMLAPLLDHPTTSLLYQGRMAVGTPGDWAGGWV